MKDQCDWCGSTRLEYHDAQPDRHDEPGHGAYLECLVCDCIMDVDEQAERDAAGCQKYHDMKEAGIDEEDENA